MDVIVPVWDLDGPASAFRGGRAREDRCVDGSILAPLSVSEVEAFAGGFNLLSEGSRADTG